MSNSNGNASSSATTEISYVARLQPLTGKSPLLRTRRVSDFQVAEQRGVGGWSAMIVVIPERSIYTQEGGLHDATLAGFGPGKSVALRLIVSGSSAGAGAPTTPDTKPGTITLTWPGVVTRVASKGPPPESRHNVYRVYLGDPVRYLAHLPIWGAFKDRSPGEILGGALSLAVGGGDGKPTLTPTLPKMPTVRITEHVREALRQVPYAIAMGEPLGYWIEKTLGRLGVRYESRGYANAQVGIKLSDTAPSGTPIEMTLDGVGPASRTNAEVSDIEIIPVDPERDGLVDNPATGDPRRIGWGRGAVDQVIYAAGVQGDEADLRARFDMDTDLVEAATFRVLSAQPHIHPGSRIEFTNRAFAGRRLWQAGAVSHVFGRGVYRNVVELERGDLPWRLPFPPEDGARLVTAVIDDGASEAGDPVERDRLGRVPVRFVFLPTPAATKKKTTKKKAKKKAPKKKAGGRPEAHIDLPIVEPMGGGEHGFVSAHRQGDLCRVSVQSPLYAEIVGFVYRDDRRLGADLVDASTGVVVLHDTEDWTGVVFRPEEDMWEDEEGEDEEEGDANGTPGGAGDDAS